jgi:hypothetical protein
LFLRQFTCASVGGLKKTLKNYKLFIYGDIVYITNSFCKKYAKIATPYPRTGQRKTTGGPRIERKERD